MSKNPDEAICEYCNGQTCVCHVRPDFLKEGHEIVKELEDIMFVNGCIPNRSVYESNPKLFKAAECVLGILPEMLSESYSNGASDKETV